MGGSRPKNSTEHHVLSDMDDTNIRKGNLRSGRKNLMISVVCLVVAFALFVGAIVLFNKPTVGKDCKLDSLSSSDQDGNKPKSASDGESRSRAVPEPKSSPLSMTQVNGKHVPPGELVFSEEFENFDTTKWQHVLGDTEQKFYFTVSHKNNSYSQNGKLFLKPTYTADKYGHEYLYNGTLYLGRFPSELCSNSNITALCWENSHEEIVHPIMTAIVTSSKFFSFQYGRLVIRAKMPGGDWTRPIISLLPLNSVYGTDGNSGRVNLVDTRGNKILTDPSGKNVGSERTCPDIMYGPAEDMEIIFNCSSTEKNQGYDTDFHDYEVLWTQDSITLKIDGEDVVSGPEPMPSMYKLWSKGKPRNNPWSLGNNGKMAPFDTPFYIALGVTVGGTSGTFSDDDISPYPKPWKNSEPKTAAKNFWENRANWENSWQGDVPALQIESIKLYSLNFTTVDWSEKVDYEFAMSGPN